MLRLAALVILLATATATAQTRQPSHCIALAEAAPGVHYVHKASFRGPVAEDTVRLTFIDHATFLLQTSGGLSFATDFTGFLGATTFLPTGVTMNNAHETHYTSFPSEGIAHVLEGWPDRDGKPRDHYLDLGEMLIRNVTTDIRSRGGGGIVPDGNSIFVFEVAGLCIGHLGHLHHEPTDAQYAAIGRLDVVMAAVDGGLTLDRPTMTRVLKRLRSSVVIPMHWFGRHTLDAFVADMQDTFRIERVDGPSITVSLATLPSRPTVLVLQPAFLREPEE